MESKIIPAMAIASLISMWIWPAGYLGIAIGVLCALVAAEEFLR